MRTPVIRLSDSARRALQEAAARLNQSPDILEDNVLRDDEKPASVDGGNRAVEAHVQTPAAGFHVASQPSDAVVLEARVLRKSRQAPTARDWERQPFEEGTRWLAPPMHALDLTGLTFFQGLDEAEQRRLTLAPDDRIGHALKQVLRVERRVEPVEADMTGWICLTDLLGHAHAQP